MATGTEEYYAQRAAEYDQVYAKPERQRDIAAVTELVAGALAGRAVLDVAAGTGFWTERYADASRRTTLCDINGEVLEVARHRRAWPSHVRFATCDAFALDGVDGRFDAAFAGFLWSHIELGQLDRFLGGLVSRLGPGATVVLVDNVYVDGSNHPISRIDRAGNTYQQRVLADGSSWEVRKNFPSAGSVASRLAAHGGSVVVTSLASYWVATFRTPDGR